MTITLITGANKGLGYETARRLIGLGHTVLAGARDRQRGTTAAAGLCAAFIHIDPTDDSSVEAAAVPW
jgi:NAD(P)-dependent dehydrogenase (short-subunit alcohol dehydrogenase family)